MAQFRVTINKIFCQRTTLEWTRDEVFLAVIPVLGRIHSGATEGQELGPAQVEGKLLRGHVTDVRKGVKKNENWCPGAATFLFEAAPDDTLSLLFFLYERDDGKVRQGLLEKFSAGQWPIVIRDDPSLKRIWEDFVSRSLPNLLALPLSLAELLVRILSGVITIAPTLLKEVGKDDLIAAKEFTVCLNDRSALLSREYDFRSNRNKGHYQVSVTLSRA